MPFISSQVIINNPARLGHFTSQYVNAIGKHTVLDGSIVPIAGRLKENACSVRQVP
jgi:hypothetical protein